MADDPQGEQPTQRLPGRRDPNIPSDVAAHLAEHLLEPTMPGGAGPSGTGRSTPPTQPLSTEEAPPARERTPPRPVLGDRYELLEELGRGGMGVVYRAHDRTLGRDVALKVLQVAGRVDAETIERFQREARAAAALDHPNIVRVHDVGALPDGAPYYTMEMLAGQDLAHAITDGHISPKDAVEAVRQVSLALLYAHQKGILHRDLKPQNIFLRRDPSLDPKSDAPTVQAGAPAAPGEVHALLLDFGLAKLADRDLQAHAEGSHGRKSMQSLTRSGEVFGTPMYMPPEQTIGAKDVDARADIYSLGAALYHALAAKPPFDAGSLAELLVKVQRQDPPPPSLYNRDLDLDLDTVCLKCLQKDPKDRYQNAGELAEDLKRWVAGDPISARPIGLAGRLWRRAKRNKVVAILATLLIVSALGGGVSFGVFRLVHAWNVRSLRTQASEAMSAARRRDPTDASARGQDLKQAEDAATSLRLLEPADTDIRDLFNAAKSEIAVLSGDHAREGYHKARTDLVKKQEELREEEARAKEAETHAGKARWWELQREGDDLRRTFEQQFAAAVSEYGNAIGYWRDNPVANERLADLYWERFQDAEKARDASGQEAYRGLVVQYAAKLPEGPRKKYEGLLRGERNVRVTFWLPKTHASRDVNLYLFAYMRNRVPPLLLPVPFSLKDGKTLEEPSLSDAEPLRLDRTDSAERDPRPSQEKLEELRRRAVRSVEHRQTAAALEALQDLVREESVDAASLAADDAWAPIHDEPGFQVLLAALRGEVPRRHVQIESIVAASQAEKLGLHAGDVLLAVAGNRVWSIAQAQAAIQAKKEGQTCEIEVWQPRGRVQRTAAGGPLGVKLAQTDLRRPDPRSVADVRWGSVFTLTQREENRVTLHPEIDAPSTRGAVHFGATLPKGSYMLFVPAGQGLYETRYPFEVSRDADWNEECELLAEDAGPPLPAGAPSALHSPTSKLALPGPAAYWVYVPAGPYHASGDRDAQQEPGRDAALLRVSRGKGEDTRKPPAGPRSLEGYFVARFEVTSDVYLAYLNDREWHSVDKAALRAPCQYGQSREKGGYWKTDASGKIQLMASWREDWPVCAISWDDAVDFNKWVTARTFPTGLGAPSGPGTPAPWEFDLPTEDEWEKAARGADGRFFPWGDDFDATFCRMQDSRVSEQDALNPEPVGLFPIDESPYGVRDLGGGLREWTSTSEGAQGQWRVVKGGAWSAGASICRSADRPDYEPRYFNETHGLRFVARRARP